MTDPILKDVPTTLYGWYSEEQAEHFREVSDSGGWLMTKERCDGESEQYRMYPAPLRYTTPDGGEVTVTSVTTSPEDHGTKWPDMEYVGEVVKCLKPHRTERI